MPRTKKPRAAQAPPSELRTDLMYAMVPVELILDPQLYPSDVVVAAVLVALTGTNRACWACNPTIAARANCSRATVKRSLERLEWAGWIAREKAPTVRRGNLIRLQWKLQKRRREGSKSGRGGGSSMSQGWLTDAPGVAHGCAPELDSKESHSKNPERACATPEDGGPERDLIPESEMARWIEQELTGDPIKRRLARGVLNRHHEAVKAIKSREAREKAAGTLAKVPPAADRKDTVPDTHKTRRVSGQKSRPANSTKHKGHYQTIAGRGGWNFKAHPMLPPGTPLDSRSS